MRLDHLLSKEEVRVGLLSICQGIRAQENAGIPKERNRRSCLIKIERALESELCWKQSGTRRFSISPVLTLNQSGRTVIIAGFYQ